VRCIVVVKDRPHAARNSFTPLEEGCTEMQGYSFSPPLAVAEIERRFRIADVPAMQDRFAAA
jgi:predicted signal transduction protein with EAL and GGDEF domain